MQVLTHGEGSNFRACLRERDVFPALGWYTWKHHYITSDGNCLFVRDNEVLGRVLHVSFKGTRGIVNEYNIIVIQRRGGSWALSNCCILMAFKG